MPHAHQVVTLGTIVVDDAAKYWPVNISSLKRLARLQISGPVCTINLFSRRFSWDTAIDISTIRSDANSKCVITTKTALPLAVGDVVAPAATGVGGYNAVQRVTAIRDANVIVTDMAYSADVTDTGTINLAIPSTEQPLYRLLPQLSYDPAVPATMVYNDTHGMYAVNTDPLAKGHNSRNDFNIYFKFSATGTYRLSMTLIDTAS